MLQDGLPVLIVNGSYTCPVFRGKVNLINQIAADYAGQLQTLIIYTVEAHPSGDISPYFGFENVGNANIQAGILYNQPTTYGERKSIVADMLAAMTIAVPVYLDGPCNNWWEIYGPAPNNAYLVDPTGVVVSKHGWFNKYPEDIICDIDELLGIPNDCDLTVNGSFDFVMESDTVVSGLAGSTLSLYGLLTNNSDEGVDIEVARLANNIPTDWSTSMCMDICYATDVSYTTIHLEPGEEQVYTMYFYTGPDAGQGMTRMGFRNLNNQQNRFVQRMYANTALSTSIESPDVTAFSVYPNPVKSSLHIAITENSSLYETVKAIKIYSRLGELTLQQTWEYSIGDVDVSTLVEGVYMLVLETGNQAFSKTFIKVGE